MMDAVSLCYTLSMIHLPQRLSIEVTSRCSKGCAFCYNGSSPAGGSRWNPDELAHFLRDCVSSGITCVAFGGGEPLEWEPLTTLLRSLRGIVRRTVTTGAPGLVLSRLPELVEAAPEEIHLSLHQPTQVKPLVAAAALRERGIRVGVQVLVAQSRVHETAEGVRALNQSGFGAGDVLLLPKRGEDQPTAMDMGVVSNASCFQSVSCLLHCAVSPDFCSVGSDGSVGWCSHTGARRPLLQPTAAGLAAALDGLALLCCDRFPRRSWRVIQPLLDACPSVGSSPVPMQDQNKPRRPALFAAHSMDTDWFAVDKDGNVALFRSGEAGAVPVDVNTETYGSQLVREMIRRGMVELRPDMFVQTVSHPDGFHGSRARRVQPPTLLDRIFRRKPKPAPLPECLFFLKPGVQTPPLLEDGSFLAPAHEGLALFMVHPTRKLVDELHCNGHCCGCVAYPHFTDEAVLQALPLFIYDNNEYEMGATPYDRIHVPSTPKVLEEMKAVLSAEGLQQPVQLRQVRFAESAKLQPAEHVPCAGWTPGYLDTAGKLHPLPGKDAEYATQVKELQASNPELVEGRDYEPPRKPG